MRSLIAAVLYVALLLVMHVSVSLGLTKPGQATAASFYIASGPLIFYAALRSGWSLRQQDPALTTPQMLFAISCVLVAYVVNPSTRSATLLVLAPVMVFGMFSLSPRQAHRLTCFTLIAFGLVTCLISNWRPSIYDPKLEAIHFVIMLAVLPSISSLAEQLARLRSRHLQQRAVLREALQRVEQLVRFDELTGLLNRRSMLERLEQERLRRLSEETPVCVCLIDLDHFKLVNDRFGHAAGDEVLRRFAGLATGALRNIDVLGRWGGEEFLLLMPDTDADQACTAIDRLRSSLVDPAAWQDRPELRVTFSAGIAQWQLDENAEQAVDRADAAAYHAKRNGRDRWVLAPRQQDEIA